LENSGFDRVWLEPVTFPVWERWQEKASIVTPYPQSLQIAALGFSGSTSGELIADVIAFDNVEKLRETNERHIQGKIVFINQAIERDRDGLSYRASEEIRTNGVNVARLKGAAAVLIRSLGTDHNRLPHVGSTIRAEQQIPAAALSAPDADQLARILRQHPLVTLSLTIETSTREHAEGWNVIAQLNGREKPEEILVMSAHLDSWDLGTGAVDDGAGVAIVSAAAQLIGALPQRPQRSIRVVLFANEELGRWGVKQYAATHQAELGQHVVAAQSDFGAGLIYQLDTQHEILSNDLATLLAPLNIAINNTADSVDLDIQAMHEAGVPVLRLRHDGTDYFDVHHTANDTLDKIDPQNLQQNVAAWAATFYLAAESDYDFRIKEKSVDGGDQ
jgi:carboxypeptidase Q